MLTIATVTGQAAAPPATGDAEQEISRLRRLLEINRLLVGTTDASELLDILVDKAAALVEADACVLLLADASRRARVVAARGLAAEPAAAFSAPLDEQIGVAIAGLLAAADPDVLIAVPVMVHGIIDGVLAAHWRAPRKPRPDDEFLMSAMTDQSAIALANAASYQQLYRGEREARETAERAVASRNELLAMVSHDLRNPLSTIAMSALLLLNGLPEGGPAPLRKQAERIQRSVHQMLRLVDDLLDVATIESGSFSVEKTPHAAFPLLRDALDTCQLAAQDKALVLRLVAPAAELIIACDRERLLQVLVNLIGNAVKFTPRGGTIELRVERRGADAVFSVADSGPGIAPDQLTRVFERYWQANRRSEQGSGLGLFIAKSLIEAHGGRLWAESEVGAGSTFSFAVAALPAPPAPADG